MLRLLTPQIFGKGSRIYFTSTNEGKKYRSYTWESGVRFKEKDLKVILSQQLGELQDGVSELGYSMQGQIQVSYLLY